MITSKHASLSRAMSSPRATLELVQSQLRCRQDYRAMLPHGSAVRARLVRGMHGHRWYHVTREGDTTSALARLDAEMVTLFNAGLAEAEMIRLEQHVRETRERLYTGSERRALHVLDAEDFESDIEEERLERARLRGEATPAMMRAEAEANRRQAAVSEEKARVLDFTAALREREALRRAPRGAA
jgi:hypothetical protein